MWLKIFSLYNNMKVAILLDTFSGHLFHDVELFIVLYQKNIPYISRIDFINLFPESKFHHSSIMNINSILIKKLFNTSFNIITDFKIEDYDIVIDRFKLDDRNINKAFASCITSFPAFQWAKSLSSNKSSNALKILYTSRQNTSRKLADDAHLFIMNLVSSYNGTVCEELEKYSIEEQIELFRTHNCIIGVHGNNLTGMMWMNPQSHVFEILPFNVKNYVYDYHCMALCMKHYYTQINGLGESHNCIMGLDDISKKVLEHHLSMLKNIMEI
jgi:hypothetical protein